MACAQCRMNAVICVPDTSPAVGSKTGSAGCLATVCKVGAGYSCRAVAGLWARVPCGILHGLHLRMRRQCARPTRRSGAGARACDGGPAPHAAEVTPRPKDRHAPTCGPPSFVAPLTGIEIERDRPHPILGLLEREPVGTAKPDLRTTAGLHLVRPGCMARSSPTGRAAPATRALIDLSRACIAPRCAISRSLRILPRWPSLRRTGVPCTRMGRTPRAGLCATAVASH